MLTLLTVDWHAISSADDRLSLHSHGHGSYLCAPPTADTVAQIIRHGAVQSSLMPPSLIEDLCADPSSLELIRKQVKYIDFAGAPLPKRVGDLLAPYLRLMPGIGSTEAGLIGREREMMTPIQPRIGTASATAWEFFWATHNGRSVRVSFPQAKGVWALAADLPHLSWPSRIPDQGSLGQTPHAGETVGVCRANGWSNHSQSWRGLVCIKDWTFDWEWCPCQSGADWGRGRKRPFLILELVEGIVNSTGSANPALAANIWPAIEKANEFCSEYVHLSRELTIFASASKPLMHTARGTVTRRDSLALYAQDVLTGFRLAQINFLLFTRHCDEDTDDILTSR